MSNIRVLRILEYEGERLDVMASLAKRGVKESHSLPNGITIKESIVGGISGFTDIHGELLEVDRLISESSPCIKDKLVDA